MCEVLNCDWLIEGFQDSIRRTLLGLGRGPPRIRFKLRSIERKVHWSFCSWLTRKSLGFFSIDEGGIFTAKSNRIWKTKLLNYISLYSADTHSAVLPVNINLGLNGIHNAGGVVFIYIYKKLRLLLLLLRRAFAFIQGLFCLQNPPKKVI